MPFDLDSAQPVETKPTGFDITSAADVDAPDDVIFHEESGKTVSVPAGLDGHESDYLVKTQVEKADPSRFWGVVDMGRDALYTLGGYEDAIAKGLASFAVRTPGQTVGGNLQEIGERGAAAASGDLTNGAAVPTAADIFLPIDTDPDSAVNRAKTAGYTAIADAGKRLSGFVDQWADKHGLNAPNDSTGRKFAFDLGQGAGSVAASIALTYLTRNPVAASAAFGDIQKSSIYREARERGFSPDEAGSMSTTQGMVQGVLEGMGNSLFQNIAHASGPVRRIVGRALEEAAQEGSQQAGEEALASVSGLRDTTLQQGLQNVGYAALLGMMTGAPVASVVEIAERRGEQEGVSKAQAGTIARNLIANQDEALETTASVLNKGASLIAANPQAESASADILRKFQQGEPVSDEVALPQSDTKRADALREQAAQDVQADEMVKQGRLKVLDQQVSALDDQIDQLASLMDERDSSGKPNVANQNRLRRMLERRDRVDEERADLLVDTVRPVQANESVSVPAKSLKRMAAQTVQERQRFLEAGLREGRRMAREDVTKAQDFMVGVLEESGLAPADRAKFIRTIKNIQTPEQAMEALPVVQSRASRLLEQQAQRETKGKIVDLLGRTKVRKQSGKPVGKYTPQIQDILDGLRTLSKMKANEAGLELEKRLGDPAPTPQAALENAVLSIMADGSSVPSQQMAEALEDVRGLVEEGKSGALERMAEKAEQLTNLRMMALNALGPERLNVDRTGLGENLAKVGREIRGQEYALNRSWADTVNLIFGADEIAGKELDQRLGGEVSDALQKSKGVARQAVQQFTDAGMQAFGFTKPTQFLRQSYEDSKIQDLGTFTDAAGREVRLQMSKAQARKRSMELHDPSLYETITGKEGNAYTPEMIDAVNGLLTAEDRAFVNSQLDFYRWFYPQINEVYARVYGVNLPNNPNYSPIAREHENDNEPSFGTEMTFRRSVAPGSLKSRTGSLAPLKTMSDIETLQKHVAEMSHFIAMAEKTQELGAVFGDRQIQKEIADKFGKTVSGSVQDYLQDFRAGRIKMLREGIGWLETLRQNFAASVLGAKPALALKQLTAFGAYAEDIPSKDFAAGIADFLAHPAEASRILDQSEMMKARGANLERDINLAIKSAEFGNFRRVKNLRNAMFWFVQAGDRASVQLGGWSVYRYHRQVLGKSHEEALREFEQATSRTQQTSDIDQLSRLQSSPSLMGRAVTMFMSGQNQFYRREMRAMLDLKRGQISAGEAAKKVFLYHFLLPMFYQFVADFGRWDDENQMRAAMFGSLNGMFIAYDMVNELAMRLMGEQSLPRRNPALTFAQDIMSGVFKMTDEDAAPEDIAEGTMKLMTGAGELAGLPLGRINDIIRAGDDLDEDETGAAAARVLGFPNSVANSVSEDGDEE